MEKNTGLIFEAWTRKDYSHELMFGASNVSDGPIRPLGRSIEGVPVVIQDGNSCVVCTVTWIRQFLSKEEGEQIHLSWPFLADKSHLTPNGATPSQVLEPARKIGIAPWEAYETSLTLADQEAGKYKVRQYSHVTDYSPHGIFAALQRSPLAVGILNFQGKGAHMMAAFDVTEDGKRLLCANWWPNEDGTINTQRIEEVPFEDVEMAISFAKQDGLMVDPQTIPTSKVALDKVMSVVKYHTKKLLTAVLALMASGGAMYGAGYAPVTGYQASLTQYITAAQTTIPVSTVLDPSGTAINTSLISSSSTKYMYFNIEPGTPSRQELVVCTGISGNNLTGCIRGGSFQGSSLVGDSSRAFPHNPGSKIIMTNTGLFYANEMVSINGDQRINDVKTFAAIPRVTSTTAVPTSNDQLTTWYAAQTLVAGGFSSLNVSTTLGLLATGSVPEKVGINASSTAGVAFDSSSGALYVNASSTASSNGGFLSFSSVGKLYWDIVSFLGRANTWAAAQVFSSSITLNSGGTIPTASTATSSIATYGQVLSTQFGDASDGVLNVQSGTTTLNTANKQVYQYESVTIGGTGAVELGSNLQNVPTYIYVRGDLVVTSTKAVAFWAKGLGGNGGAGGTVAPTSPVAGTSGSSGAVTNGGGAPAANLRDGGGGGGGLGNAGTAGANAGGTGGTAGASNLYSSLSSPSRKIVLAHIGGGGGGGGAGSTILTGNGGAGGKGGGFVVFIVGGSVNITGTFDLSGENGSAGVSDATENGGGGGGGGGGFMGVYYKGSLVANTATIRVNGGTGGAAGAGIGTSGGAGGNGGNGQSEVKQIRSVTPVVSY